jgi:GNAT superfamily N-acetyltransferase
LKGFASAPLTPADASAVTAVWQACETHDDGEARESEEDFVGATRRPSADLERESIAIRDGEELVAFGWLIGERQAFVHVLPSHRGRGLGAWLLRWTQDAGRALGRRASCQTLTENEHAAMSLLEADGYERTWAEWDFDIRLEQDPDPPRLPPGYGLREFVPGRDDRAVYDVVDAAFGEWDDEERATFEDWAGETLGRPGFVPEHIATVVTGEQIVAVAVNVHDRASIWVGQLAVAREHRGRGLARALLTHTFGFAWRAGPRRCGLGTDARTGARGLYEHVGMRVARTSWSYVKTL